MLADISSLCTASRTLGLLVLAWMMGACHPPDQVIIGPDPATILHSLPPEQIVSLMGGAACPHNDLADCNLVDSGTLDAMLTAIDAEMAKWGSEINPYCQQAYNALFEVLSPSGLNYGEAYTYGITGSGVDYYDVAVSLLGGSWFGIADYRDLIVDADGLLTTDAAGYLFHEGLHMAGHAHGSIIGYTPTSLNRLNGQFSQPV